MMSVPIPVHKEFKLSVKYFPLSLADNPKEFIFSVGEFVTLSEIRQKLLDNLPKEQTKQAPFITKVHNKNVVEIMGREKFIRSVLDKNVEIIAFERPFINDSIEGYFLVEVKIVQGKKSYFVFSGV